MVIFSINYFLVATQGNTLKEVDKFLEKAWFTKVNIQRKKYLKRPIAFKQIIKNYASLVNSSK